VQTVYYEDPAAREAARDLIFLYELDRQAEIATQNITEAWTRGLQTQDVRDPQTWSLLQGALFAAIIVARILKPRSVRRYDGLTLKQSRELAENRGARLRGLLEIRDDSELFCIDDVRDSFEHFDERLEARLIAGAHTFSDWYISDGTAFVTSEESHEAVGLRVFFPAGGTVYFDRHMVDLFALDVALLDLRYGVKGAQGGLRSRLRGRGRFVLQAVHLMSPDEALSRREEWLRVRAEAEAALNG
jgi:hypothetical protein